MSKQIEHKAKDSQHKNKTVFSLLSNLKQPSDPTIENDYQTKIKVESEIDDTAILRNDPETNQKFINKSIYLKLHRSLSPNRSIVVDKIKEKYESLNEKHDLVQIKKQDTAETLESLKLKYSPANLGYTKSKVPIPKPRQRNSLTKTTGNVFKICTDKRNFLSYSPKLKKEKDLNSNDLAKTKLSSEESCNEIDDDYFRIVTRSDSEESVFKIQRELSIFTMDKKKRTNSFRKLFTGKLFGSKDKKKQQNTDVNDSSLSRKEQLSTENNQNECYQFSNKPLVNNTRGKASEYNKINERPVSNHDINVYQQHSSFCEQRQSHKNENFGNQVPHGYVPMDRPIFKSNDPNVYIQVSNIRPYDTSSSASVSTTESERLHNQSQHSEVEATNKRHYVSHPNTIYEYKRDTPPRALETRQDVRLVNPKAIAPMSHVFQKENTQDYLEDTYGTVFDSIEYKTNNKNIHYEKSPQNKAQKTPQSPSLEPSKLKIPPNRKIVPLSPRIRSPIPQENVSTEKIIATELLRSKLSPSPSKLFSKENKNSSLNHSTKSNDSVYHNRVYLLDKNFCGKTYPVERNIQKSEHERYLNDSKSSNEISSSEQCNDNVILRRVQSPHTSTSNVNKNNSIKNEDDISVQVGKKPEVTMTKTFRKSNGDNVGTRRFYEVGHITNAKVNERVMSDSSKERTKNFQTTYENNEQTPFNFKNFSRLSLNSDSSNQANARVYSPSFIRTPTPNKSNSSTQSFSASPMKSPLGNSLSRPTTPLNANIPESPKTTPQKEEIRKNVEAYYWNEIRKLKDKENYDLYLYQMQYANLMPQNFVTDQDRISRSRSISPSIHRNTKRSLSLPRDKRSSHLSPKESIAITENKTVAANLQLQNQNMLLQENFVRNSPQRSTVDGSFKVGNFDSNSLYRPIFKRGSLSTPPKQMMDDPLKRKVSFSKNGQENRHAWPTRNGFTKSPPQRRVEKAISSQNNDSQHMNHSNMINGARYDYPPDSSIENFNGYYNATNNINDVESIYGQRRTISAENPNGQQIVYNSRCEKQNIMQNYTSDINASENIYGQRQSYNENSYGQKRSNTNLQEDIYGRRLPHAMIQSGNQTILENPYGRRIVQKPFEANVYKQRISNQNLSPHPQSLILYGQTVVVKNPGITRHGSIQLPEEIYGYNRNQIPVRRISQQTIVPIGNISREEPLYGGRVHNQPLKREIIVRDEIYGQFGGYVPSNLNKNNTTNTRDRIQLNSRVNEESLKQIPQKHVTVNNKVCDFYGQIHDTDLVKTLQSDGVLMGQLQKTPNNTTFSERNSISQIPTNTNFFRNSRLTASANDMYKRMPNTSGNRLHNNVMYGHVNSVQTINGAPTRPLPPIPPNKIKQLGRSVQVSDTESGSDASEIQRILNSKGQTSKRNIFRK